MFCSFGVALFSFFLPCFLLFVVVVFPPSILFFGGFRLRSVRLRSRSVLFHSSANDRAVACVVVLFRLAIGNSGCFALSVELEGACRTLERFKFDKSTLHRSLISP